ncbi:MAG: sugar phosphate isomerase/epimerase [Bacillus cereus]|jgi:hexulose-6-phosphate isomerase|nr:sugar phosphate isomerase/epimerase [Bacillus cereus]
MKKAITIWALSEGVSGNIPILYASKFVKTLGFDALEVSFCRNGEISQTTPVSMYKTINKQLKEQSLTISSISTLLLNDMSIISDDKEERNEAMNICKNMIEAASLLDVPTVSISPGRVQTHNNYINYYRQSLEQVGVLLDYAQKNHITLCIENVWQGLLLSPMEMENYINHLNNSNLGVCIDIGNTLLNSFPQHWLKTMGNKVKKIHITDLKKRRNSIYEFRDPGHGDVEWVEIMQIIKDIGFDEYLTIEAFTRTNVSDEERIVTLSNCLDTIIKL